MPTHTSSSVSKTPRAAVRPLRVAMLVANAGTGDARVMKQAESLVLAGHQVTVYGLAARGLATKETVAGVRYRRCAEPHRALLDGPLPTADSGPGPASTAPGLVSKIKEMVEPFVRHELMAATFVAPVAAGLPDIIHAHDFETLPAAIRAAKRCGARVLYDMHELEEGRHPGPGPLLRRWKMWLEGRAHRHLAAAITTSPSYAERKASFYNIPEPILIMNGPRIGPAAGPTLRERCGLGPGTPLAVYIGLVSPGRGIETLLSSLGQVPGMHLAFLGQIRPELEPALAQARKTLGNRLHVLAPVPHAEVVGHIESADVGICTIPASCLSYELCLPNKLLEMTLAGLPLLVANTIGLSRFVAETGTAHKVDATDPAAVAAGLMAVYADRLALKPSPEALAALRARFGWERQAARLIDVYDAVALAPRGMPAAMAQRALATVLRPVGYSVSGG
jgi:glycosyltransferase involved in cell wall biosynthesis